MSEERATTGSMIFVRPRDQGVPSVDLDGRSVRKKNADDGSAIHNGLMVSVTSGSNNKTIIHIQYRTTLYYYIWTLYAKEKDETIKSNIKIQRI